MRLETHSQKCNYGSFSLYTSLSKNLGMDSWDQRSLASQATGLIILEIQPCPSPDWEKNPSTVAAGSERQKWRETVWGYQNWRGAVRILTTHGDPTDAQFLSLRDSCYTFLLRKICILFTYPNPFRSRTACKCRKVSINKYEAWQHFNFMSEHIIYIWTCNEYWQLLLVNIPE